MRVARALDLQRVVVSMYMMFVYLMVVMQNRSTPVRTKMAVICIRLLSLEDM